MIDHRRFRNRLGRVVLADEDDVVDVEFRPGAYPQQPAYWGEFRVRDVVPATPTRRQEERWLIQALSK